MNNATFVVRAPVHVGSSKSVPQMCVASAGKDSVSLSAARWARFRDCWAGEWSGHWERVDALSKVSARTAHRRIFTVAEDGKEVRQRNVVESTTWHRGGGLERSYTHTQASFDAFPLLTLVRPGGDGLQVSRGRLGALEKTISHPTVDGKRAAIVLLFAAGGIGLCTYLTETRLDMNGAAQQDNVQDVICMGSDGEAAAVPAASGLVPENTLVLTLGGGEFKVHIPRDLNKCYGKPFTVSFRWTPRDAKSAKTVLVHFDGKQQFVCEQSLTV